MKVWLPFVAFVLLSSPHAALSQEAPPPAAAAQASPASAPASQPAAKPSRFAQGPLRIEMSAMLEGRYRYFDADPAQPTRENELRMQFRVAGADVVKVVRHGNVILDEVIDDTGQSLFDSSTITAEQRAITRLSSTPPDKLAESGVMLVAAAKGTARAAKTLRSVRGSVKLVLSSPYQEVTIVNPQQYVGKPLDIPRLKELGIEATIVPPDTFNPPADAKSSFTIQYTAGADRVRAVNFYDGWMNVLRSRATTVQTPEGKDAQQYRLISAGLDEKSQMVIQIFPDAREETLRFELKDVPLP